MADILFIARAGHQEGLGHVVRARWLARALAERHGLGAAFQIDPYPPALAYLEAAGMAAATAALRPVLVILDLLAPQAAEVAAARSWGAPLVSFEHPNRTAQLVDQVVNPVLAGLRDRQWRAHGTPCCGGPGYVLLAPEVVRRARVRRPTQPILERVVVSCGGTDPAGRTGLALAGLAEARFPGLVDVVVGPGAARPTVPRSLKVRLHLAPQGLAHLLDGADLAILSAGLTAYEAACLGVPAILLTQNTHQRVTAHRFQRRGCARWGPASPAGLGQLIQAQTYPGRQAMAEAGRSLLDGAGTPLLDLMAALLTSQGVLP